MSANATYRYAEDHAAGHHRRHNGTNRANVLPALGWWQPEPVSPTKWDDVANWKGKTVWGLLDGKRQQLLVMSIAPEGNEGERWYVTPTQSGRYFIASVSKAKLELVEKPVTCTALTIASSTGIKTRPVRRALNVPEIIYL